MKDERAAVVRILVRAGEAHSAHGGRHEAQKRCQSLVAVWRAAAQGLSLNATSIFVIVRARSGVSPLIRFSKVHVSIRGGTDKHGELYSKHHSDVRALGELEPRCLHLVALILLEHCAHPRGEFKVYLNY